MTGTAAAGVSVRSAADGKGVNGAGQDRVPQSPVNESRPPLPGSSAPVEPPLREQVTEECFANIGSPFLDEQLFIASAV